MTEDQWLPENREGPECWIEVDGKITKGKKEDFWGENTFMTLAALLISQYTHNLVCHNLLKQML